MILLRYFSRSEKSSENWQLEKIERRAALRCFGPFEKLRNG